MEKNKENYKFPLNKGVNHSSPRRTSPLRVVLGEIQCADIKTPTKICDTSNVDPWTPTANLKMLISAASPDIRNREREILEEQFSGDELEKAQPSRKEKSLGLLCHKFLARYPKYPNPAVNNSICLDEVAGELNVERRRIYDIVNVLESLHMVSRLAKNKYLWHGRLNLSKTFEVLKKVGDENKYAEQIILLKKRDQEELPENDESAARTLIKQTEVGFVELPGVEFRAASVNSRKEKSLRVMSQRFVMLFLVSSPQIVSLDVAAKILIGEDQLEDLDKSKFKTKIRRLYDIANVLSSLDLIKKVHVTEERGRKPAFQWTGPESSTQGQDKENFISVSGPSSPAVSLRSPKENCAKNLFASQGKQNFTRHQSLIKLAKSIDNDRRKINSAPSSPTKTDVGQCSVFSSSKMAQLAAICKQQLDRSKDPYKVKAKMSRHPLNNTKFVLKPAMTAEPNPPSNPGIPLISTHLHSPAPYTVYVQPQQARTLASQSPSAPGHAVLCAHKTVQEDEGNLSSEAVTKDPGMSPGKGQHAQNEYVHECFSKRVLDPENCPMSKRMKGSHPSDSPERLIPSGYLIPVQLAPLGTEAGKDVTESSSEQTIFTSPLAGVIPLQLMFSPGSLTAVPVLSPCGQSMTNWSGAASQSTNPRSGSTKTTEELTAAQVLNVSHLSPIAYHGQPIRVFTLQQPGVPLTPKGSQTKLKESFFQTPGGPMSSPMETAAPENNLPGQIFISQRKLDVGADD
ncbi:transcription factor E2F8 [Pelobates cultripes]|uniref:Transcription factor E2F8 n=1 Tax=Pelobates cultripes TaxID=61616 RepID=A0AAD1WTJ0_PELCU|nr:transcription factor E2F8 [Pelobates cultripes]